MGLSSGVPGREITTYPEMNETIKDLLRWSDEPMHLYIVTRIEELEAQLAADARQLGAVKEAIGRMKDMQDQPEFDSATVQECLRLIKTALEK